MDQEPGYIVDGGIDRICNGLYHQPVVDRVLHHLLCRFQKKIEGGSFMAKDR
jgi:hypothetical protein